MGKSKSIRNYTSWDGDDVPGKGSIGFDKRTLDVEFIGFMSSVQRAERIEQEIRDLKDQRQQFKDAAKICTSDIKELNDKLKRLLP